MAEIIVKEEIISKYPIIISEVVTLPGIKGDKGDPFTYDDFTPEQIAELQRPATEAAAVANQAAENANKEATDIKVLGDKLTAEEAKRELAESIRTSAESDRAEAEALRESNFAEIQKSFKGIISDANTAISNASIAADKAENAATEASDSATLANAAANNANQVAQNVDNRVTAVEEKASQSYDNLAAIQSSNDKNVNKIYIDKETNISYRYDSVLDTYVSIGESLPENLAYVEEVASEEPSEQLEFIADKAIKDFNGNVINETYATKEVVNKRLSEVYTNLSAIKASGEIDKNKIYIAGDTLIPYTYNGNEFVPCNAAIPKGGYNRALFEAAGAVFNEDTGYYELYANEGGLTDITEDEMYDIYTQTAHLAAKKGENYNLFSLSCRTNFKGRIFGNAGINELYVYGSNNLEVLFLKGSVSMYNQSLKVSNFNSSDFYDCPKLKKVIGVLDLLNVGKVIDNITYNLYIEDIKISRLKTNLNIFNKDSVINYESIKYLVDNAANTSAITITVHPTTYGYLTGTIQPTEQVGGTTEEWQAIVTTAAEKQITFATTE